jgi:hypothetical protein
MIFFHIEEELHNIQKIPPEQVKKIVQIEQNTAKIEKRTPAIGKKYPLSYEETSLKISPDKRQIEIKIAEAEKSI